jgi:ATP-dependent helicase HrpB
LRDEARRLHAAADLGERRVRGVGDDLAAGIVAGLAFPERIARRRGGGYLMTGGTGAELAPGSGLTTSPWLSVAVAQRQPGAAAARIRLAAAIDEATALELGAGQRRTEDEVGWIDGDVVARRVDRLGAIVLGEKPLREVPAGLRQQALREGLAKEGLSLLRWTDGARALRARLALLHQALDWPDVSDAALLENVDSWLGPDLFAVRRRADLGRVDVASALRRLLDHRQAARLAELAPERIAVPSGSHVRVTYDETPGEPGAPVLAVKLQETFGWRTTPRIADGRVPVVLHLLSPGGRPLAVTSDLESFWAGAYPAVRGEMRGRYPKHPWPEDPSTAVPTARTNRRRPPA